MVVCLCHNVSELELTQAVDLGLSTMDELRRDLGVAASCGACAQYAEKVLIEQLRKRAPGGKAPVQAPENLRTSPSVRPDTGTADF